MTPPLRRWAARLALLMACAATVATSKVSSPPVTSTYQGETLRLTAASPTATRQVIIRATAKNSSKTVGGDALVEVLPTWHTTNPSREDTPSVHVRWRLQGDESPPGVTHRLGQASSVTELQFLGGGCRLDEDCQWTLLLDVEVRGELGEDEVTVDWRVHANMEAWDTEETPEGLAVHISEP